MIVIPMFLIVVYAFTTQGNDVATLQFTFDNFKKFFTDPDFLKTLWLSLRIAFITTILCILIGYPVAYAISKASDRKRNSVDFIDYPANVDQYAGTYLCMDWNPCG